MMFRNDADGAPKAGENKGASIDDKRAVVAGVCALEEDLGSCERSASLQKKSLKALKDECRLAGVSGYSECKEKDKNRLVDLLMGSPKRRKLEGGLPQV